MERDDENMSKGPINLLESQERVDARIERGGSEMERGGRETDRERERLAGLACVM